MNVYPEQTQFSKFRFFVVLAHVGILYLLSITTIAPPMKPPTKKLIVKTISLQSERVIEIAHPPVVEPVLETIALQEEPAIVEPTKVEEETKAPEVVPVEEKKIETPPPPPAPAPKPPEKPKNPPKPKPKIKKEEKSKPKPKPSIPKKTVKKVETKPAQKKAPAKPSAKPAPKKAEAPVKSEQQRQKEEALKKEQAKTQALLQDALSFLDSSAATGTKKSSLQKSSNYETSAPTEVKLQASEITPTIQSDGDEFSGAEKTYYDELIHRLRLALRLPEYGAVKLKLTLSSDGKVIKVQITTSKSPRNKSYIEKTLPGVSFPRFGSNFSGQKEQTFRLNLCNELRY